MSRTDKKNTGRPSQKKCIAPEIGARVYDYYNGALGQAEVREFERHLIVCSKCEAIIFQLDEMMTILDEDQDPDHFIASTSKNGLDSRSARYPVTSQKLSA
jgi:hypothetical protein